MVAKNLGNNSKVAIWAHNGHIADGSDRNIDIMGTFLSESQGDDFKNVGFSLGKGSFNAIKTNEDPNLPGSIEAQKIDNVPCNTLNYTLSAVDYNQYYFFLDEIEGSGKFYFDSRQPIFQLGARYDSNKMDKYIFSTKLSDDFDVLIHFDETNASLLR